MIKKATSHLWARNESGCKTNVDGPQRRGAGAAGTVNAGTVLPRRQSVGRRQRCTGLRSPAGDPDRDRRPRARPDDGPSPQPVERPRSTSCGGQRGFARIWVRELPAPLVRLLHFPSATSRAAPPWATRPSRAQRRCCHGHPRGRTARGRRGRAASKHGEGYGGRATTTRQRMAGTAATRDSRLVTTSPGSDGGALTGLTFSGEMEMDARARG